MIKICNTTMLFLFTVCFYPASKSFGQTSIAADSLKNILIKDWERAKAYTQDYLKVMPSGKYSLRATDSVRSFAQQLLHITQGNMFLVSTATGDKPTYAGPDLEKSASAQSADSVMYYVNMGYDYAYQRNKKAKSVFSHAACNT